MYSYYHHSRLLLVGDDIQGVVVGYVPRCDKLKKYLVPYWERIWDHDLISL